MYYYSCGDNNSNDDGHHALSEPLGCARTWDKCLYQLGLGREAKNTKS